MGRRTKLDDEVQRKIIDAMNVGNFFHVSCEYAGVSRAIGFRWMARGRDAKASAEEHDTPIDPDEQRYVDFCDAVEEARSQAEVRLVSVVTRAAVERMDWRAAVEILRRGFKENWRDEARVELGGGVKVKAELDDGLARLEEVARIVQESSGPPPS